MICVHLESKMIGVEGENLVCFRDKSNFLVPRFTGHNKKLEACDFLGPGLQVVTPGLGNPQQNCEGKNITSRAQMNFLLSLWLFLESSSNTFCSKISYWTLLTRSRTFLTSLVDEFTVAKSLRKLPSTSMHQCPPQQHLIHHIKEFITQISRYLNVI